MKPKLPPPPRRVLIARPHWLAWSAVGAVAISATGGYILTRALPGGFLGDHGDVGSWHCLSPATRSAPSPGGHDHGQ